MSTRETSRTWLPGNPPLGTPSRSLRSMMMMIMWLGSDGDAEEEFEWSFMGWVASFFSLFGVLMSKGKK
jgi:transposase